MMFNELKKLKATKQGNSFSTGVSQSEIKAGQDDFGSEFPSELVMLYKELGAPYLARGLDEDDALGDNVEILTPSQINELVRNESETMIPYAEGFNGFVPFAYLGDNHYLCVDRDNAVYGVGMNKLHSSFAAFMDLTAHKVTAYRDL